ncbi:MAG: ribosome hibernation-promoting factor, HPF/YfiA family [Burkholderiales bacterium]
MEHPLQISFHGIDHSAALEVHIRGKAAKLTSFHPNITSCRVVVENPHEHKHQGQHFTVRIDVHVPGGSVVVNRESHEDVYVALRDAFDATKRQLVEHAERLRGDVKQHPSSTPGSAGT